MKHGTHIRSVVLAGLALATLLQASWAAAADVSCTGLRAWASPTGTRVVCDFSAPVVPVAPDSGRATQLVVAVPSPGLTLADGVPATLAVGDSAIVQVRSIADANGVRFWYELRPATTFRVFTLPAGDGKPFRVVVEVARAGATTDQDQRLASIAAAKKRSRARLVCIDAGHGGEDQGAHGPGGILEKNVTLAFARRLADSLNAVPGVRAILTRDSDFFIPLHDRYKIAEKARADLFVSIHCNSSKRRGSGSGTEVYFLSLKGATDQADQDLADIENAADKVGGVGPQADDEVVNVLYDVKRNSMLERSQMLAETLLDHVATDRRVEARGIKQAGFAVLKSVEFPSVLVETAFINNPIEVKLLADPAFQSRMVSGITNGIEEYFAKAGITLVPESTTAGGEGGGGR